MEVTEQADLIGPDGEICDLAFAPDGKLLAAVGTDEAVWVWSLPSRELLLLIEPDAGKLQAVSFSPDGKRFAVGAEDGGLRCWNLDGTLLWELVAHSASLRTLAFTPSGNLITGGSDGTIRLWEPQTAEPELVLSTGGFPVTALSLASIGGRLAVATERSWSQAENRGWSEAQVWDLETGSRQRSLEHPFSIDTIAFSPDRTLLVTGGADKALRIWDADRGVLFHTLEDHEGALLSAAFTPDGRHLATAGWDEWLFIWEAATWSQALVLQDDEVWGPLAFSPNAQILAAANTRGVQLFHVK